MSRYYGYSDDLNNDLNDALKRVKALEQKLGSANKTNPTETRKHSNAPKIVGITLGAVALIALIVVLASVYTVAVNTSVIVVQMGKAKYTTTETGLHAHIPFIENTVHIYTGKMMYDIPSSDVITADKKSMIADDYVIWRVTDPIKYYQTLGAVQGRAEERIEAAVYNATKNTISSLTQDEIIAARGDALTSMITTSSNTEMGQYGIEIELAEIKALDLPENNKTAVYERMISERLNIAAGYTAKGNAEAQKIKNDTDRKVSVNLADAKAKAAVLEAEGEAEYMKILSAAYNDPDKAEFYNYVRGLDSLKAIAKSDATIILDKDSEYAKILYGKMN